MLLGVNIDHIATLRQARYATMLDSFNVEPSVLDAAYAAQRGGADSITLHVRGDRRHMQDADALSVRESVALPLNLEMGNTPEMVDFALAPTMARMADNGIQVSLFIDPEVPQVEAAARLGAPMIELHTGCFANHSGRERTEELARLKRAAELAHSLGIQVNAGHGINYQNLEQLLAGVPYLHELNIGHTIVSRALFVGMEQAVREMRQAIDRLS